MCTRGKYPHTRRERGRERKTSQELYKSNQHGSCGHVKDVPRSISMAQCCTARCCKRFDKHVPVSANVSFAFYCAESEFWRKNVREITDLDFQRKGKYMMISVLAQRYIVVVFINYCVTRKSAFFDPLRALRNASFLSAVLCVAHRYSLIPPSFERVM